MPLNISSSGTTSNISFGPARVLMDPSTVAGGVSGTAPVTDVGFINEDGVTLELTSEKRIISQGNPRLPLYSFVQAQDVMINFTSIQWDFDNFLYALGGGVTSSGVGTSSFEFGGNALNTLVSINIEHQMAVTGNTINCYIYKAQSESGFSIPLGQDEHQFEFQFRAIRSEFNFDGIALASGKQLINITRTS